MTMLNTEFTINLGEPIKPGKVIIGYFDGVHPSIVAVTRSDKIFVHNPHNRLVYDPHDQTSENAGLRLAQYSSSTVVNDLNFLNINQTITCLASGSISSVTLTTGKDSSDSGSDVGSDGGGSSSANNKKINSTGSGHKISIHSKSQKPGIINDILVIGTKTSIHAYDILHNTDLYYKEIPDGANTLVIGEFGQIFKGSKLALVGGNCAIHGFDREGHDTYWMVTGDNITAMALVDIDSDHQNELVVGSQDCEIQVFKKDAIIAELSETDCVTHLCSLGPSLFAYALANGTVGVYRNKERIWRIKSKNQAMTLFGADINNDGQMELLTGWSNGKLDIRIVMTGEVLYRENYKCSVAGITIADYNMDGRKELIVCTVAGDVYGYKMENQDECHQQVNFNIEQNTIRDLMKKKQTLMQELRNYEENARIQNLADPLVINKGKVLTEKGDHFGAIPASTKLKSSLILQSSDNSLPDFIELRLETTNTTKIRAAIIFAEGIFKHESIIIYPSEHEVCNIISVPLKPPKDVPVDMYVKALVGYQSSSHYHVFELSRRLPRFSMYSFIKSIYLNNNNKTISEYQDSPTEKFKMPLEERYGENKDYHEMMTGTDEKNEDTFDEENNYFNNNIVKVTHDEAYNMMDDMVVNSNQILQDIEVYQPESYVVINLNEQIGNAVRWITTNFLLDLQTENNEEERRFEFISLRDQSSLIIEILRRVSSKSDFLHGNNDNIISSNGKDDLTPKSVVIIYSPSIEVAGNCVQSLGDHFKITNLPCYKANFPEEIKRLKQLVNRVEEIQSIRQHLVVEVADNANMIRAAVVQVENARLTEEYQQMKKIHNDLSMLNKEIIREYKIRCQNHQDLVDSLKQINIIIQRASNLRIGSYKTAFITSCREAIKQKNFAQLFKIINED